MPDFFARCQRLQFDFDFLIFSLDSAGRIVADAFAGKAGIFSNEVPHGFLFRSHRSFRGREPCGLFDYDQRGGLTMESECPRYEKIQKAINDLVELIAVEFCQEFSEINAELRKENEALKAQLAKALVRTNSDEHNKIIPYPLEEKKIFPRNFPGRNFPYELEENFNFGAGTDSGSVAPGPQLPEPQA